MSGLRRFGYFLAAIFTVAAVNISMFASKADATSETIVINDLTKPADSFELDSLKFTDIHFEDLSNTSARSIGITGNVTNTSKETTAIKANVRYKLAKSPVESNYYSKLKAGESTLSFMENRNFLRGSNVSDIQYITITFETIDGVDDLSELSESDIEYLKEQPYYFTNYDVNIEVFEDNKYRIVETIDVYYNEARHGLKLGIPTINTLDHDGESKAHYAQVLDVEVEGDDYETSYTANSVNVKIGNAARTVTGPKRYVLTYIYNWGKDVQEGEDEFYWNIISGDREAPIQNTTFTIKLPKDFDAGRLGFTHGKIGTIDTEGILFEVQGNTITGSYSGILKPGVYLTTRISFDEGYFVGAGYFKTKTLYFIYLIPLGCLALAFLIWFICGRDERFVESAEFYPPEDINSAEAALILKEKVDSKDVMSLLYYLAGRGYLLIEEGDTNGLTRNDKIYKLHEYDGVDYNERVFMSQLFGRKVRRGDNGYEYVTTNELKGHFYKTVEEIKKRLNSEKTTSQFFIKNTFQRVIVVILAIVALMGASIAAILEATGDPGEAFIFAFMMSIEAAFIVGLGFTPSPARQIIRGVFILQTVAIISGLDFLPIFVHRIELLIGMAVAIASFAAILQINKYMPRKTQQGANYYNKIKSLKRFITSPDQNQLDVLKGSDPSYFFAMIAFAAVFGSAKSWMRRIAALGIGMPDWYVGENGRAIDLDDLRHSMNRISYAGSFNPTSYGGGSSGGGGGSSSGSSGGGSSGGGGGGTSSSSW